MVHSKIFQILLITSSLIYLKAMTNPGDELSSKCMGPDYRPSFSNGLCATDCIFKEGQFKNGDGFYIEKMVEHTKQMNPKANVAKTREAIEHCISKLPEYLEEVKANPEYAKTTKNCDPKPFALYLCVTGTAEE